MGHSATAPRVAAPFIMAAAGLGEEGHQGSDLGTADGKDTRPSGGELQGNGPADSLPALVTTARRPDNMPLRCMQEREMENAGFEADLARIH